MLILRKKASAVILLSVIVWFITSSLTGIDSVNTRRDSVPDNPLVRNYDIFGSKYSRVEIKDNSLEGAVYYLMSGHGGPDPGAQGKYGPYILAEDEYAYDVTLRLARKLIEHGALVYMITRDNNDGIRDQNILQRDKDERCYPAAAIPINQVARLKQRTNAVNKLYLADRDKFQRVIITHMDSRGKNEDLDVYFGGGYLMHNVHGKS